VQAFLALDALQMGREFGEAAAGLRGVDLVVARRQGRLEISRSDQPMTDVELQAS